jgi:hypothetical protein
MVFNPITGKLVDTTPHRSAVDMYQLVTGYYANANCYIIDTQSKERNNIFQNYNVKKVPLGLPSVGGSSSD